MALNKILSGQISLTAGVAVQGTDTGNISSGFYITFPEKNTSTYAWVGNAARESSSDVSSTDLFYLKDDGLLFFNQGRIQNLNELWFMGSSDATTDGADVVCWITG
jgi:hypothetical protein